MAHDVQWSEEARADIGIMPVFRRGPLFAAIDELRAQAEFATRNRKPLAEPIEDLPDATWEIRVGDYRVFYRVIESRIVQVLRVILKGTSTTAEAVARGRRR